MYVCPLDVVNSVGLCNALPTYPPLSLDYFASVVSSLCSADVVREGEEEEGECGCV